MVDSFNMGFKSESTFAKHTTVVGRNNPTLNMKKEEDRLVTFKTWPIGIKQTGLELCKAGLYYSGLSDVCVCPYCNIAICEWNHEDIPLYEHYKFAPHCEFIHNVIKNMKL